MSASFVTWFIYRIRCWFWKSFFLIVRELNVLKYKSQSVWCVGVLYRRQRGLQKVYRAFIAFCYFFGARLTAR